MALGIKEGDRVKVIAGKDSGQGVAGRRASSRPDTR